MPDSILYDAAAASMALGESDPRIADLIASVGPPALQPDPPDSLFAALLKAIVYQQLSGKAAATIFGRVETLLEGDLSAPSIARLSDEALRGAGMSRAKIRAARDLARHVGEGSLPDLGELSKLPDGEAIRRLTVVKGIGPWTVQMLLLFRLGRPDVWPATDLGIRKGVGRLLGTDELPSFQATEEAGNAWRPWRSVAAWYLWRSLDIQTPE